MSATYSHHGWEGSFGGREFIRWGLAAAIVVGIHAGAVAAVHLWQDPPPPPMEEAASAIMLDLAPLAVAPEAIPDETPDIVQTSQAAEPVEEELDKVEPDTTPTTQPVTETAEPVEEQTAEPVQEDVAEPTEAEPVEDVAETVDEVEEIIPDIEEAPLPEVAMAIPSPRPEPVEKKPEPAPRKVEKPAPKKPVEKKEVAKPQTRRSASSQARADRADTSAAPKPSVGSRSTGMSPADWQSKLYSHINRRKRGVSVRGAGVVQVSISIDAGGQVLSASVARSSGNDRIDKAGVRLVNRSSPVPAPPPGVSKRIVVPIAFER
ncbi:TonB family protein [Corticibacterium sp. UT-5YL-CI-8]|nr:TonB family protein [Tianweitania sp. UT-5YL-CI-8]